MALLRGLLREQVLFPGAVLDAGANTGLEACQLAMAAPERAVHAVDPDSMNVRSIGSLARVHNLTKLRPVLGGLGEQSTVVHARINAGTGMSLKGVAGGARGGAKRDDDGTAGLQIYSIDDLFSSTGRHGAVLGRDGPHMLALAHFDLEGAPARAASPHPRPIRAGRSPMHTVHARYPPPSTPPPAPRRARAIRDGARRAQRRDAHAGARPARLHGRAAPAHEARREPRSMVIN